MKNSLTNSRSRFSLTRNLIGLCSAILLMLGAAQVKAAVIYWDPQGLTGLNPYTGSLSGSWEGQFWSTNGSGTGNYFNWIDGDAACFAIHTGVGTPAFTVTMNANHIVGGFFDGPLTPDPCAVTINGTGIITLPANTFQGCDVTSNANDPGSITINVPIAGTGAYGNGLCAEGTGQLFLNGINTYSDGSYLGYSGASFTGIWNFTNADPSQPGICTSFGTGGIFTSNCYGGLNVEGAAPVTVTNSFYHVMPVSFAAYSSLTIVGNPAGVTFSGPWALSGSTFSGTTVLSQLAIGSGGAANNLVTISGLVSGTNGFTKVGVGILALSATNAYSGNTIISNGTLAVTGAGSISNSAFLSIQTNTVLDVSGLSAFNLTCPLNAYGVGATAGTSPSTINGPAGGVVNAGSEPLNLTFTPTSFSGDSTHPGLQLNQAALTLNNNTIMVTNASATPLGVGTYTLIQVGDGVTGTINGTPNSAVTVYGAGLAAGTFATLAINGSTVSLVVATATTATTTTFNPALSAVNYGTSVTFTANVSPIPDGGVVQFLTNGVPFGAAVPVNLSTGVAVSPATSVKFPAGTYTITAQYSGAGDGAYGASSATSSQVISKDALTVTANAQTLTYGAAPNITTAFTSSGLVNGETIGTVTLAVTGGAAGQGTTNEPAGSYTVTPSAATAGSGTEADYTITYAANTLTVNPKALTINANNQSRAYGSSTSAPTTGQTAFSSSGLVNAQTNSSINISLSYTGISANSPVAGSPYTGVIVPSAAVEASTKTNFNPANYTITYNDGTLTITNLAVKLTGLQNYNGSNWVKAGTLIVSNAVAGDTVDVALGLGFLASTNPGIQTIASVGTLALGNAGDQGAGTGTGPTAQFNTPTGVAVDINGNAYVADTANNRIVEVTPGGVETVLPITGLVNPSGVAVDTNGNIYVADPSLNEIVELPAGGGTQTNLPISGLNYPAGLAVDQSGDVFVADTLNSRVVEYTTGGAQTTLPFSGATSLYLPSGVAVDTNGDVFVANAGSNDIVELSASGVQTSNAFTGLNFATSVAVDNNTNVYVANYGGASVKELSAAGVVSTLDFTSLGGPAGVAVDSSGNIIVTDSAHNRLVETNSTTGFKALAGTLGIPNYTVTGGSGTVTNSATPSFVGLTNAAITYGATNITLTGIVTAPGNTHPANGTVITVTINGTSHNSTVNAAGAFTNNFNTAGLSVSGSPYTITYSSAASGAFTAATDTTTALTINPLPVILTGTIPYNGDNTTGTLTVSNAVSGDDVTVTGSGSLASANAGVEPISSLGTLALAGATAGNYTLVGATGAMNVTPDALAITANGDSKVYGQTATYGAGSTNFTSTGLTNGDTIGSVTLTASGGVNPTDAVGSYSLTPSLATGGTFTPANYTITYNPGTLAVTPLPVVLAGSKPYDGTPAAPAADLSVANAVSGDSVTLASGAGVLASPAVGPEAVSAGTLALGGPAAGNYTLVGASGAVTVTAGSLNIAATPQSKTYGQTLTVGSGNTNFVATGLQNGETVGTVTIAAGNSGDAATAQVSGSPYTLTPSAPTGGTFNPADYTITYTPANLTVNPATLTVTATNISRVYGATNPVFTVSYTNFVNGETLGASDVAGAPLVTSLADTNSPVGTYDITNTIGTLTSTNYTFALLDGTLTVTNAISTNSVVSSGSPALPGTAVTFTDTVSTLAPSMAVPYGAVQFLVDGAPSGAPVTLTNGIATLTTSDLTHGSHAIEADYAGDTNIAGSANILTEVINTAPVAGTATFARQADLQLTIPIAQLLTNATDADGDTLSLMAVSATSTNGASLATNATTVTYTQAAVNPNVTDSFTYTVSDPSGAMSTGTVIVTIATNTTPSTGGGGGTGVLPNGNVDIGFTGTPGYTYYIEATTNLLGSPIIWTIVSTNVADSNGNINYIDTSATNNVGRYFRTVTP